MANESRSSRKGLPQYGKRSLVCGVGVFDAPYSNRRDEITRKACKDWCNMLNRCYGNADFPSKKSYKDCVVCEDWHSFLKFREWFDKNYISGYFLDKDVIKKGNKEYGPYTCCYIPSFINTLLLNCRAARGKYPLGVSLHDGRYVAQMYMYGKHRYLGIYTTIEEAFSAYKEARETYIKEVAKDYFERGAIDERVYNSLMEYRIETTD